MPVGNASDGIGLFAGQIMISGNMNLQHIDWGHDPIPNEDFEHFGHLNTVLLLNPKNEEAIYNLTLVNLKKSDFKGAKKLINDFKKKL